MSSGIDERKVQASGGPSSIGDTDAASRLKALIATHSPAWTGITSTRWFDSKFLVVVLLIFVFPIGCYGLWKNAFFSRKAKLVMTPAFAVWWIMFLGGL